MPDHRVKLTWRDRLIERITSMPDLRENRQSIGVIFKPHLYSLVKRAAEARGMSLSSYLRRAVLSFACFDLGLDWYETMADDRGANKIGRPASDGVESGGHGFGKWQIEGLHD
jgi:hypothetical protein